MMAFGWAVAAISLYFKLFLYRIAAGFIVLLGFRMVLRGMSFLGWIFNRQILVKSVPNNL